MKSLTIRDIPNTLLHDLKEFARIEKRSLNSQIIHCLSVSVSKKKPADRILKDIRLLKNSNDFKGFELSLDEIKSVIEEGRL